MRGQNSVLVLKVALQELSHRRLVHRLGLSCTPLNNS
jgi:hypothetical protein